MTSFRDRKEMIRSLKGSLTLLVKDKEYFWATFDEIKNMLKKGFTIYNKDKKEYYEFQSRLS